MFNRKRSEAGLGVAASAVSTGDGSSSEAATGIWTENDFYAWCFLHVDDRH